MCSECEHLSVILCVRVCIGKEDGKTCKRVAIRTTIRKDDCRSNAPVREPEDEELGVGMRREKHYCSENRIAQSTPDFLNLVPDIKMLSLEKFRIKLMITVIIFECYCQMKTHS